MVLSFAMSLAGLNPEEFRGLIAKLTPSSKPGVAPENVARPLSPSGQSESSGIGSLAPSSSSSSSSSSSTRSTEGSSAWPTPSSSRTPSIRSTEGGSVPSLTPASSRAPSVGSIDESTPSLTPISSGPASPTVDAANDETVDTTLIDVGKFRRDILNLAANIREPGWQVIKPPMTHNDPFSYLGNKIVNRLDEFNLEEDYPMRFCDKCGFGQPSPYLV